MAFLFSDDFNRVGAALGNGWTEQTIGASPVTNMSTDGNYARIDSNTFHVATCPMTPQEDQFCQVWVQLPAEAANPGQNNAGLVFRYQDSSNFYFLHATKTTGVRLFQRRLGINSLTLATFGLIGEAVWHRLAVRLVGTILEVYIDNRYATGAPLSGPELVFDVSTIAGGFISGAGVSGICSSGNDSDGLNGLLWNDFAAWDGSATTIYVDTAFNGGAPGEGFGSQERPDIDIGLGLNNAGLNRGGKLIIASTVAIGDDVVAHSIGHGTQTSGKFGGAYTFPTYSPDNGQVIDPGSPNLTIESADAMRVTLEQSASPGTGKAFFRIRSDATGIVFRGFDYEAPSPNSAIVSNNDDAASGPHDFQLAKCKCAGTNPLVSNAFHYRNFNALQSRIETHYCYFKVGQGTHGPLADLDLRVQNFVSEFCVYQGKETPTVGNVNAAIGAGTNCDPQVGDSWILNHNTFVNIFRNLFNSAAFSVLDPTNFKATVQWKNNIVRGSDIAADTEFGVYTGTGTLGAGGSIGAHHNGYFNVDTPRDVGVTDEGNEILTDPQFIAPANPFEWQHSQGGGINGEGTFLPMTLDGDYRPMNEDYIDTADDSAPLLGVLDRGALQSYLTEAPGGGSAIGSDVETSDLYCISVIYDRGGANETDLSSRLIDSRPLKQEKDVLLRQYRASDTTLQFADPDGDFIEILEGSFLRGTDGRQNWLGKPVDIFVTQGGETLVHYKGFVINAMAGRGFGMLQVANRYQRIFDRLPFANSMGRVVSTTSAPGMGDAFVGFALLAPASGAYLTRVTLNHQSPFDAAAGAPFVETLRFSFLSGGVGAQFSCTGSLTGPKGFGSVSAPFEASDGSFSILDPTDWEHEDLIVAGQECTLQLVWRPTAGLTIIDALLEFLTDAHTCAIDPSEIDMDSFDSFRGTIADQPVSLVNPPVPGVPKSRLVVDQPQALLKYLPEFALHVGASLIERADGRFALNSLVPRAIEGSELPVLCKSDDLMELQISHLDVYNVYAFSYNRSEVLDRYQSGGRWPPDFNSSFSKYQRLLPAPTEITFRGFDESARPWIEIIAQSIFLRYQDPARTYSGKLKLSRMGIDLDSVFRIDSEAPTFEGPVVEPFVIERHAIGELTVDCELLEVRVLTGECGDFAQYDNPAMSYDDPCWSYF